MRRPRRYFKKVKQDDNREQELGALGYFLQQGEKTGQDDRCPLGSDSTLAAAESSSSR
jgi:hypothetical protein